MGCMREKSSELTMMVHQHPNFVASIKFIHLVYSFEVWLCSSLAHALYSSADASRWYTLRHLQTSFLRSEYSLASLGLSLMALSNPLASQD